jgi:CRP-like cAMP-binding protein
MKKVDLTQDSLIGIELFQSLDAGERKEVVRYCHGAIYAPKHEIVRHLSNTEDVYFISAGRVQATVFSTAGRVITFQELREGDTFGELSAIDQSPRASSVITITESFILRMAGQDFRTLVANSRVLNEAVLRRISGLVRFLIDRVVEFHALPVPERVRAELLRLVRSEETDGNRVVLSPAPTHADIASRVGTNREAVTRVLGELTKMGLVSRSGSDLTIDDVAGFFEHIESAIARD